MTCKPANLEVLAYAGGFNQLYYKAAEDDVTAEGYFNRLWERMNADDLLIVGPKNRFYNVIKSDRYGVEIEPIAMGAPIAQAVKKEPKPQEKTTAYTPKHRGFGKWDVLDSNDEPINTEPLTKDDAKKLAEQKSNAKG